MKNIFLLILISAFSLSGYSQTQAEYEVIYNSSTGLYEARVHVVSGAIVPPQAPFTTIGSSSFSIVVPESVPNTPIVPTTVDPAGTAWTNTANLYDTQPNGQALDYRYFITGGGGVFPTFQTGDVYTLFTFSLGGSCVGNVRVFNNGSFASGGDGSSAETGGGNFSNSLQFITGEQYSGNRNNEGTACIFVQDVSGPWDIATNWVDDQVPTVNDDAIIDAGVVSYLRADQAVNNLELRPGSTVSVPQGFTLNIKGDVINDGDFTLYEVGAGLNPGDPTGSNGNPNVDGEVLLDGSTTQELSGAGNYYNLRVNNPQGVDVINPNTNDPLTNDPTEINGALFLDNGTFTTNDNVLFPCDFGSPTGPPPFTRHAVGQIGPVAGTISGNVSVEQCFPGRRAYRLVSASTTGGSMHNEWQEDPDIAQGGYTHDPRPGYGTHITGLAPGAPNALLLQGSDQLNGLDWQPSGNVSVFSFDNADQIWDDVLNTETTTLAAGDAYLMMIRGSRAVDLTINASPTSDTKLESTGTVLTVPGGVSVNPGVNTDEFALVGNPYHAVVDLSLLNLSGSGYSNSVTVWDPNIGGVSNVNLTGQLGGRGGYVTVDATTGIPNILSAAPGVTVTDATNQLQPYQSFFVQRTEIGTGELLFEETDKNVRGLQTDVFSSSQPRIFVTLFDKESLENLSTPDDGVVIYFSNQANNAVDANDAPKFFNQDEVIARNENGTLVSFENRAMPVLDDVLKLYTNQYRTTNYVLEIGVQFLPEHTPYLIDSYTGTETPLENNQSSFYSFSVDQSNPESIATDRFRIVFQPTTLGSDDFDLQGISVYPVPATDILNISFGENSGRFDSVELFDISGRLVAKQSLGSQLQDAQLDVNTFSSGVYLLKVSSGTEQFTTKVMIE